MRPYLTSFTFTDNAGGKADDISLTLQDARGEWLRDWVPAKSDTITASILTPSLTLPCGNFSVDQADYSFPPRTLSIKGVSSDIARTVSSQLKTRVWENIMLKDICAQVASDNQLALFMDVQDNWLVTREEQIQRTDLEWLNSFLADFGWSVKIQKDTLIVYDTETYEAKSPALELDSSDRRVISCRFSTKAAKIYRKARVRYHDPVKDEDYDEEFEDDDEEGSERDLVICTRADSKDDAKRIARERVINANRREVTGSVSLLGSPDIAAGITVMLSGFGMFSGQHFVNKVTHKVDSSGYTTAIELGQPKEAKRSAHTRKAARKKTGGTRGEIFYEGEHYYK